MPCLVIVRHCGAYNRLKDIERKPVLNMEPSLSLVPVGQPVSDTEKLRPKARLRTAAKGYFFFAFLLLAAFAFSGSLLGVCLTPSRICINADMITVTYSSGGAVLIASERLLFGSALFLCGFTVFSPAAAAAFVFYIGVITGISSSIITAGGGFFMSAILAFLFALQLFADLLYSSVIFCSFTRARRGIRHIFAFRSLCVMLISFVCYGGAVYLISFLISLII